MDYYHPVAHIHKCSRQSTPKCLRIVDTCGPDLGDLDPSRKGQINQFLEEERQSGQPTQVHRFVKVELVKDDCCLVPIEFAQNGNPLLSARGVGVMLAPAEPGVVYDSMCSVCYQYDQEYYQSPEYANW